MSEKGVSTENVFSAQERVKDKTEDTHINILTLKAKPGSSTVGGLKKPTSSPKAKNL